MIFVTIRQMTILHLDYYIVGRTNSRPIGTIWYSFLPSFLEHGNQKVSCKKKRKKIISERGLAIFVRTGYSLPLHCS